LGAITSLTGPVEEIDGKLMLRIPLEAGGDQFIRSSTGISRVEGDYLIVTIPEWLAGMLRIQAGTLVSVDNQDGKFNIHPINPGYLQ
jgi:hypothetical protein